MSAYRGYWRNVWHQFRRNRLALAGLCVVGILLSIALLAPLIANDKPYVFVGESRVFFPLFFNYPELRDVDLRNPAVKGFKLFPPIPYSYSEYDLDSIVTGPGGAHWLGTDEQGRDLAARMVHGARVSMMVGLIAVIIYVSIGMAIGAIAGYYGGAVDIVISRVIEIVICFPTFFLILTMLALVGPSLVNVMVIIGITGWTGIARIVRGEFLKLREMEYVQASRSLGVRDAVIIFRHMLPNSLAPVLVSATFGVASTILIESSLSFLGFGVQPPTPSWGDILSQSRDFMDFAWWLTLIPGSFIFITITAYNLVGEGFQDAINPRALKVNE
ncbi:MAG: ABC transporter permease [Spirochaetes bacterium]|nr:MAG: ABC transporter permease [Spirochaetota bacterium]